MQEQIHEKNLVTTNNIKYQEKLTVNSKTDLAVEEVEKVIDVFSAVYVTEKEVLDGKVKFGGNVIFQIVYKCTNGEIKKCESATEFVGYTEAEKATQNCKCSVFGVAEKATADLSGLKVSVECGILITAYVTENVLITPLIETEELITDKKEKEITVGLGSCKTVYPLEEQFDLDYAVKDVLCHNGKAVITAVQCGVGCIIVDGETVVSAIIKRDDEKLCKEQKVFPFRMEIECEEAMPVNKAVAYVNEKSFKWDVSVDTENKTSSVSLSATLIFEGEAFEERNVLLVTDAFNKDKHLQLEKENISFLDQCETRSFCVDVTADANVDAQDDSREILFAVKEKVESLSIVAEENKITGDGVISCHVICKTEEDKIVNVLLEAPFSFVQEQSGCDFENVTSRCAVKNLKAKKGTDGSVTLSFTLTVTVYPCLKDEIEFIKSVVLTGDKEKIDYPLSVYLALEGEGLFSLAKRLNVSPSEVVETNKDLQFPLTGKERVVIYRQK